MQIGIGITTRNRYDIFKKCLDSFIKYSPKDIKIIIVDDASEIPLKEATFRFEENVGIAIAKNKCLELLENCTHIFLSDDDCYPIQENWHLPYINSGLKHAMYLFKDFKNRALNDSEIIYQDNNIKAFSHPRGCLLYYHNSILPVVGGMDIGYKKWGYEHVDLSNRIYNAGLTPFRYIDIKGSEKLIYSADESEEVESTVTKREKSLYIQETQKKFQESFKYKKYCSYKENAYEDVVITTYTTSKIDPQRNNNWETNITTIEALKTSTELNSVRLYVLNDCFNKKDTDLVKYVKVSAGINPYVQRWLNYWVFLERHPEIKHAFFVDATDVEMLKNPFGSLQDDILYIGHEKEILGCKWIINTTKGRELLKYIVNNKRKVLLNGGIVGGSREILMKFCKLVYENFMQINSNEFTDMPIINFIAYNQFKDNLIFSDNVNTIFKGYEKNNKVAWFKHK